LGEVFAHMPSEEDQHRHEGKRHLLHADACEELANNSAFPEARRPPSDGARQWRDLADRLERLLAMDGLD
jgi:hypothetical protein